MGWYHGPGAARPQPGTAGFSFARAFTRRWWFIYPSRRANRPKMLCRKDQTVPLTQSQLTRPLTTFFVANTFRFAKKSSVLQTAAGSKRGGQALTSSATPALQARLQPVQSEEGAHHVRSYCPHRHRLRPTTR
jgi:hypothetical protein